MISAASVQDQELSVGPERSRIDDPAVSRRRHLGTGSACDRNALLGSTEAIRRAELANLGAVERQRYPPLGGGESDGWRKTAGVIERQQAVLRVDRRPGGIGMRGPPAPRPKGQTPP